MENFDGIIMDEHLIKLVRGRPAIWYSKHPQYRNHANTKRLWEEVGRILKSDTEKVKSRWRLLRDRYVRGERCAKRVSYSSSLDFLKVKTQSLDLSHFTLAEFHEVAEEEIFPDIPAIQPCDPEKVHTYSKTTAIAPAAIAPAATTPLPGAQQTCIKNEKSKPENPPELEIPLDSNTWAEYSSEELFYLSIAKEASQLDHNARITLRQKILTALANVIECEGRDSAQNECEGDRNETEELPLDFDHEEEVGHCEQVSPEVAKETSKLIVKRKRVHIEYEYEPSLSSEPRKRLDTCCEGGIDGTDATSTQPYANSENMSFNGTLGDESHVATVSNPRSLKVKRNLNCFVVYILESHSFIQETVNL